MHKKRFLVANPDDIFKLSQSDDHWLVKIFLSTYEQHQLSLLVKSDEKEYRL